MRREQKHNNIATSIGIDSVTNINQLSKPTTIHNVENKIRSVQ